MCGAVQPPLVELGRGIHPALFKIEEARPQHSQQAGIMEDQFVNRIILILAGIIMRDENDF